MGAMKWRALRASISGILLASTPLNAGVVDPATTASAAGRAGFVTLRKVDATRLPPSFASTGGAGRLSARAWQRQQREGLVPPGITRLPQRELQATPARGLAPGDASDAAGVATGRLALEGPIFDLLTPFTAEGDIDFSAFGKYLQFLNKAGVPTVLCNAEMGEFSSLTVEERSLLAEFARLAFSGTVLNHVSASALPDVTRLLSHSSSKPRGRPRTVADAVLIMPPYSSFGMSLDEGGAEAFLRRALKECQLPVFLCGTRGNPISAGLYTRLCADFPLISGIVDSSGDAGGARAWKDVLPARQVLVRGDSGTGTRSEGPRMLDALREDADGCIVAAGNPLPELAVRLQDCLDKGDVRGAEGAQQRLDVWAKKRRTVMGSDIAVMKAAVAARVPGFQIHVRPPCEELGRETAKGVTRWVANNDDVRREKQNAHIRRVSTQLANGYRRALNSVEVASLETVLEQLSASEEQLLVYLERAKHQREELSGRSLMNATSGETEAARLLSTVLDARRQPEEDAQGVGDRAGVSTSGATSSLRARFEEAKGVAESSGQPGGLNARAPQDAARDVNRSLDTGDANLTTVVSGEIWDALDLAWSPAVADAEAIATGSHHVAGSEISAVGVVTNDDGGNDASRNPAPVDERSRSIAVNHDRAEGSTEEARLDPADRLEGSLGHSRAVLAIQQQQEEEGEEEWRVDAISHDGPAVRTGDTMPMKMPSLPTSRHPSGLTIGEIAWAGGAAWQASEGQRERHDTIRSVNDRGASADKRAVDAREELKENAATLQGDSSPPPLVPVSVAPFEEAFLVRDSSQGHESPRPPHALLDSASPEHADVPHVKHHGVAESNGRSIGRDAMSGSGCDHVNTGEGSYIDVEGGVSHSDETATARRGNDASNVDGFVLARRESKKQPQLRDRDHDEKEITTAAVDFASGSRSAAAVEGSATKALDGHRFTLRHARNAGPPNAGGGYELPARSPHIDAVEGSAAHTTCASPSQHQQPRAAEPLAHFTKGPTYAGRDYRSTISARAAATAPRNDGNGISTPTVNEGSEGQGSSIRWRQASKDQPSGKENHGGAGQARENVEAATVGQRRATSASEGFASGSPSEALPGTSAHEPSMEESGKGKLGVKKRASLPTPRYGRYIPEGSPPRTPKPLAPGFPFKSSGPRLNFRTDGGSNMAPEPRGYTVRPSKLDGGTLGGELNGYGLEDRAGNESFGKRGPQWGSEAKDKLRATVDDFREKERETFFKSKGIEGDVDSFDWDQLRRNTQEIEKLQKAAVDRYWRNQGVRGEGMGQPGAGRYPPHQQ